MRNKSNMSASLSKGKDAGEGQKSWSDTLALTGVRPSSVSHHHDVASPQCHLILWIQGRMPRLIVLL